LTPKGLFNRSFTPRTVITDEVYKRDYKRGDVNKKAGDSKLRFEPRLLQHWVKLKNG
jgi:hypothetical protein